MKQNEILPPAVSSPAGAPPPADPAAARWNDDIGARTGLEPGGLAPTASGQGVAALPGGPPLPVHFFTIVLNGMPFLRHHIDALKRLPFDWHWHLVEGLAELNHDTAWSKAGGGRIPEGWQRAGLSVDGTTEYLDALKREFPGQVSIYRPPAGRFWDGKRAMVSAPLPNLPANCLLWQVDSDELWTLSQLIQVRALFLAHPEKTAAYFYCHYFVGPERVITSRETYGNYSQYEWLRVWRYQAGDRWVSHEPPCLCRGGQNVAALNPFRHAKTEPLGLVFQHYAYAREEQVRFKESYYGYSGAVVQWRRLQQSEPVPHRLADYFAWVKDAAIVSPVAGTGLQRLAPDDWLGQAPAAAPLPSGPVQRILFVRTDAIGDAVVASAMLEPIHKHYPGAKLAVLCQDYIAELFVACPFVDTVICYPRLKMNDETARAQISAEIAAYRPDLILNSMRGRTRLADLFVLGFKAARHVALESDLNCISEAQRAWADAQYELIIPSKDDQPEPGHHADFLRGLGIEAGPLQPVVWTAPADEQLAESFFQQQNLDPEKTIAVWPGAMSDVRIYHHYHEALKGLEGFRYLIMGDAQQEILGRKLQTQLGGGAMNLCGRTTLREAAALLRRCRLYVGAESAGAHLACAVGLPNVVVLGGGHFGRFMPLSRLTSAAILPLNCYQCNWQCRYRRTHCVQDVPPAVVAEAIKQTLEKKSDRPRVFLPAENAWRPEPGGPRWKLPVTPVPVETILVEDNPASAPVPVGNRVLPSTSSTAPGNQPASGAQEMTPASGSPRLPANPVAAPHPPNMNPRKEVNTPGMDDPLTASVDGLPWMEKESRARIEMAARNLRDMTARASYLAHARQVKPYTMPKEQRFGPVWQYWNSGVAGCPPLVQECLASVRRYVKDREIIVLNDDTLHNYVTLPDHILAKREQIGTTHFSDILRVTLLARHGGTWIDASVLLTGKIDEITSTLPFFMFTRPNDPFMISNWFIHSLAGHPLACTMRDLMTEYWMTQDKVRDYFMFHFMFECAITLHAGLAEIWKQTPTVFFTQPHLLQDTLNSGSSFQHLQELCCRTPLHKLSWKFPAPVMREALRIAQWAKGSEPAVDCSYGLRQGVPATTPPDSGKNRTNRELVQSHPSPSQSGIAPKTTYNIMRMPYIPEDGVLYDQPNKYARPLGLELGAETLIHGYQEFRLTANAIEPLPQDPPLLRKRQLLSPVFDADFLAGKTLLDLGANGGFFTFWARQRGAKNVVALDMDENYIGLIRNVQAHFKLNDIRTVSCRVQDWEEPAEVVLAFALVHWLFSCTAAYGSLDAVVGKLRSLTQELLVIEWVAPEDVAITSFKHTDWNRSAVREAYTLAAFEAALRRHFARVEIVGQTSGSRVLYFAWCRPREITLDAELPLLAPAGRVLSSRFLVEIAGKKYFSRVYLGEDGRSIWKQATGDLARRDAELLRRLQGPHFPRVLEARQEAGWSVAIFERILGCELAQVVPQIAATPQTLATFFRECLDILAALQAAKITHRDIQIHNLLIRDGHPVLIDFGWSTAPDAPCFNLRALGDEGRPPDGSFCDVYAMGKVFATCAPVNDQLFSPLISAMTAVDPSRRITAAAALHKILGALTQPAAWPQVPVFGSTAHHLDPQPWRGYVPAILARVTAFLAGGNIDAARSLLETSLLMRTESPALHSRLGEILLLQGAKETAVTQFAEACRLDPANVTAGKSLASTLLSLNRLREAAEALSRLIQPDPKDNAPRRQPVGEPARAVPPKNPAGPAARVSIIIPTFNRLDLTRACLNALRANTPAADFEIVVVDNASTDGTPDFLAAEQTAGRLRAICNANNGGFARACNQGAAAARADILLFLNNDTQVTDGWLAALVAAVSPANVGVAGAKLLYANGTIQHAGIEFMQGLPDHPYRHAPGHAPAPNQFRELDMLTGACFMIHRRLFRQLAGFDEVYRNGVEDIDLCLRVRAAGFKVVYEPKAVVFHLEGQSEGRFDHVNDNLKIFFARWRTSFDQKSRFVVPPTPRFMPASQSLLLAPASAPAGEPATPLTVSWEGVFLDHGSLSHVNRELISALKEFPGPTIQCVDNGQCVAADAAMVWPQWTQQVSAVPAPDAAITLRHAWPPDWKHPNHGKLVVIQPWEFSCLPEVWVRDAAHVDEFWVPSEHVRRAFVESGVPAGKVVLVPNGVDPAKFHPQVAPLKLATRKKFKFLFVGGTIGRKGADLLLQAYLKDFTAEDDVCLVIKDFGGKSWYVGQTLEPQIRALQGKPRTPEILYLNEELPPDSLPALYRACDCLVLPYRGEGYGLPVVEAMACGLPVIVTAGGATDDFVRDEFAYRIPATKRMVGREIGGMKMVAECWMLEPDREALVRLMRQVVEHPDEARERGRLASRHAREHCTWRQSAALAAQRLRELGATPAATPPECPEPTRAQPAPLPLPEVARLGELTAARQLMAQQDLEGAWQAVVAAMARRPFHPEAYLLLAEIALAAGAGKIAKRCAQQARDLAPGWKAPKQFLCKPLKDSLKVDWLQRAALPEPRPQPRLSVCIIAKNEEQFIAQCLQSIQGLAAQMVLVDTGSTDRTVEIARELGAEIHAFAWCDDFAAARNAALQQATGDWILMLDADEELPAAQHARLAQDMGQTNALAFRLPLVNAGRENEGRSMVPRLYRNLPGAFYRGRIHEQLFPSLLPSAKTWGLKTALGSAELRHHGYSIDVVRDRNKVERNLKLLRAAIADDPNDINLIMNLGMELARSGDLAAGLEYYRDAYARMSAQPESECVPELREALLTQFTCHLLATRSHEELVQVCNSPLAHRHGGLTASLHFALGLAHFELQHHAEAAEQMRQCLARRKQLGLTPINTDILTSAPDYCLALCLTHLNQLDAAEKAFAAALAAGGNTAAIQTDLARCLRAANRPVDALKQLHEVVTADPRQLHAWQLGGDLALSRPEYLEVARDWTASALEACPENPVLAAQRAEALMLISQAPAAAEMWEKIWRSEHDPRTLAALILCELGAGQTPHAPNPGEDERATSRGFIEWYQKLIAFRAKPLLEKINGALEPLGGPLPTAAQLLRAALAEAAAPTAV